MICFLLIMYVNDIKFNCKTYTPGEHSPSKFGLLIRFWGFLILDGLLGSTKFPHGLEYCSKLGVRGFLFSKSNTVAEFADNGVHGVFGVLGSEPFTACKLISTLLRFKGFKRGFGLMLSGRSTWKKLNISSLPIIFYKWMKCKLYVILHYMFYWNIHKTMPVQ